MYSIKPITNFEDFESVFKVFEGFPYSEIWTPSQIKKEFDSYKKNGYVFGYYIEDKCVGMISAVPVDSCSVTFDVPDGLSVIYVRDIAVLPEFRHRGIGSTLFKNMLEFAKKLGYSYAFFRYSDTNPMILGIAKKLGFTRDYDACEVISHPRHDDSLLRSDEDLRFFMYKKL